MKDFPTHEGMMFQQFYTLLVLGWRNLLRVFPTFFGRRPRCQHYIHQGTRYNVPWWQDVVTRLPGSVTTLCWSQLK